MKESTIGTGTKGTIASQTVATTKYSVGTAIRNKYGDRYVAVHLSTTQAGTLYMMGYGVSFASTVDGAAAGKQVDVKTGIDANTAATNPNGKTYYFRIAGCEYFLPMFTQSSGSDATVIMDYQTFND